MVAKKRQEVIELRRVVLGLLKGKGEIDAAGYRHIEGLVGEWRKLRKWIENEIDGWKGRKCADAFGDGLMS